MNRETFINNVKEKLVKHNEELNSLCNLEDMTSPRLINKDTKINVIHETSVNLPTTKEYIEFIDDFIPVGRFIDNIMKDDKIFIDSLKDEFIFDVSGLHIVEREGGIESIRRFYRVKN